MRTARLSTVRVSVDPTRCQYQWGGGEGVGPQVNKFAQISRDTLWKHDITATSFAGSKKLHATTWRT